MQRVIEAASEQFLEQGYDRASMEAVAQASGVSKMTLYNYFPSKDALFEACVACRTDSTFADFADHRLDPAQPAQSLARIARQFLALMRDEDALRIHRILYSLGSTHPEVCARFYKAGPLRVTALVRDYLAAATAAGSLRISSLDIAADQFLALLLGRPHTQAILGLGRPDSAEDEALIRENVALFLARYGTT
ncbi:MAG: TetR/AcrR family transcriptional regulator [Perlucidibaca sp.]